MTWEDRDAFNQFCAALIADYRPEGATETQLAQAIAEDNWRVNRARALEHNLFALGSASYTSVADSDNPQIDAALAQAQTFRDESKTFALITLYEQRIYRNLHRNVDRLHQLQSERRAARAQALAELIELKEFNRARGKADMPANPDGHFLLNGFVFSDAEIDLATFRRRRANLHATASNLSPSRLNPLYPTLHKDAA